MELRVVLNQTTLTFTYAEINKYIMNDVIAQ